jgi:hypothetical protein
MIIFSAKIAVIRVKNAFDDFDDFFYPQRLKLGTKS